MIKPASRLVLKFTLATCVAAVVLTGAVALRLLTGPLPLTPLTPFLEAQLNKDLHSHAVRIGDTALRWSRAEGRVDLSFLNVRLLDRDNRDIALIPEVEVGLSAAALGRGLVVPQWVELLGPSATLIRRADGGVQLGFAREGAQDLVEGSAGFFADLSKTLSAPPSPGERQGYLQTFLIRDASFTVYDELTGSLWHAPKARLNFRRSDEGLVAHFEARVGTASRSRASVVDSFGLKADAVLARGADTVRVTADLDDFNLSRIAGKSRSFAKLAGLNLPLDGRATLILSTLGRIESSSFRLSSAPGHFVMPGFPGLALDVRSAEIVGRYDGASDTLAFDQVTYDGGQNKGRLQGLVTLQRSADRHVTAVDLDLDARDVALDLPIVFSEPGHIDRAGLRAHVDFAAGEVVLQKAALRTGAAVLDLTGSVKDAPGAPAVALDGTIKALPVTEFAKLWPIGSGSGARDWILTNISKGQIDDATIKIDAEAGVLADDKLPDEAIAFDFKFSGLETTYLRGLAPMTGAQGRGHLSGNQFRLWVDHGQVGTIAATDGRFVVTDISERGHPAQISVHVKGGASDLLATLNAPRLGFADRFGVDPGKVGGIVDGTLDVTVPMRKTVTFAEVKVASKFDVTGFRVPNLYKTIGIDDGLVHVAVTEEGLEAKGSVTADGAPLDLSWRERFHAEGKPSTSLVISTTLDAAGRAHAIAPMDTYLEGPTPLRLEMVGRGKKTDHVTVAATLDKATVHIPELNWTKPAGQAGRVSFTLDLTEPERLGLRGIEARAADLDIRGDIVLDQNGKLMTAALDPVRAGRGTAAKVTVKRARKPGAPREVVSVTVGGSALDASNLVTLARKSLEAETDEAVRADLDIGGHVDRLKLAHGVNATDVAIRYVTSDRQIAELSASGKLNGVEPALLTLAPNEARQRIVRMRTNDGGALFAGLALTDQIVGGRLVLDMTLPPLDQASPPPPTGLIDMTDFRVRHAPVLAKLLTVASFGGVRDLLNGDGIAFETLSLPFRLESGGLRVVEGRAYGPAIGLTLDGAMPMSAGTYGLTGTLVPAYTLNTLLGYVPMLGNLLVSRSGEGVIGLTYAIDGDSADPHVFVNPLSAFAPGFLRRLFQIGDAGTAVPSGTPQKDSVE